MDMHDQALGGFLGSAIGDELGTQAKRKQPGQPRPGIVTMNTHLNIVIGWSLINEKGLNSQKISERYFTAENYPDNGSIKRLYPCVLWTVRKQASEAFRLVWDLTCVTHSSEIVRTETLKMLILLRRIFKHGQTLSKVELIEGMTYPIEPVSTELVSDTFDVALWGFMESDSFEEGLLKVIKLGGDSITAATIYGQIAGAYYGKSGLPDRLLSKLGPRDQIEQLVQKLL